MKKYPRTKATGKLGVTFVEKIVSEAGCIFRETPQDTDVGIDGYIEFVENEIATGTLVAVQIKSGESFLKQHSDDKHFSISTSKEDMNYWNSHTIPVALIAYDPTSKLSGWLDITGYIRKNIECLQKENTTLAISSKTASFTAETFISKFRHTFLSYRKENDLFNYVNLMASQDNEERFQGFLGLMNHPKSRFSEITCYLLIKNLFNESDKIKTVVTDAVSRYLNHPEVGFFPPKEISNYVQTELRNFGINEVASLLNTSWLDEENLMQRGSLGQCAGVIIINIPNYQNHLVQIATHKEFKEKTRIAAIALAEEFGVWMLIEHIVYYFDKIDWGDIRNDVKIMVESYAEFIHIPFVSIIEKTIENESYDDEDIAYALRDAGTPILAFHEYSVYKIEDKTTNPIVKFYAQQASHRIMRYKGQSTQDLLPGIEVL